MPYTQIVDLAFVPGDPSGPPGPLARFLPPLEKGSVLLALTRFGETGDLVLDPFGASPRLIQEAAQAGRAVLVACNNPITRFVIRHVLQPFSLEELQAALARLAAAPKDGGRLEPFLLKLYRTQCSRCGEMTSADYFVWDRELEQPVLKSYICPHCNYVIEEPTAQADLQLALEHSRKGLQHALALEQVAPPGDPDRSHAEAALAVYPGRAVFAIATLLTKFRQLEGEPQHRAALALGLSALDEVNALWGHPEGRIRPLQLVASPRYREANLWRALERAVGDWAITDSGVPLDAWPDVGSIAPGRVALFPGPVRELAPTLRGTGVRRIVTVLPRPNQAYWTLSALWAGWLWGRPAAAPIKAVLRRRRYDWGWHAGALRMAMGSLATALAPGTEVLGLMPDAEPGFLAAALAGLDGAGFGLTGRAVRVAEGQVAMTWTLDGARAAPAADIDWGRRLRQSMVQALAARGEPAAFPLVHSAAWFDLARDRILGQVWEKPGEHPLGQLAERLIDALGDRETFQRFGRGVEPESGQYWLTDAAHAQEPLADRIEAFVVETLQTTAALTARDLEARLCLALPGLLTPDRRMIMACLRSYAVFDFETGHWSLRAEDRPEIREADCQEILRLLKALGQALGFRAEGEMPLEWLDEEAGETFSFYVEPTARLGAVLIAGVGQVRPEAAWEEVGLFARPQPPPRRQIIVVPGGRAALVAEKVRQDPRVRLWMQTGQVLKFRHVRRLAAETTLDRANLLERLAIDPPGHHDPQMPLL